MPGITENAAAAEPPSSSADASAEDDLRRHLRQEMQNVNRREPLDPTYKKLVQSRVLTHRVPVLFKDKFYKRVGSRIRMKVERYMQETQGKDPFDRISQRKPLDEDAMRSAFTLREAKEHEQVPLLEATLASQAMHPERKRHMDGMALALQSRQEKKMRSTSPMNTAQQAEEARLRAELDAQRKQARQWEETRKKREEAERRRREEESIAAMRRRTESPQQALHKIIEPVFKKLWDMEFQNLGGTNPFRIVIDRDNCAAIGAPDYFDIITTPMNLTYIQNKVSKMQYSTLQSFFGDIDLMISNAIKYNSDPGNPYRVAAEEMKKRHDKIVKRVWQQIHQRQQAQKS
mmetsp:Transcript_103433/g.299262  ORF Transcript_103433/g.299262 Transcript_103433/m.299262 type:complete len:346 (-) Transcript_103433:348-1385(-)|eukprot:CAMPEP_0176010906 /NCGR_PEP_ID=MMETSP0120_2-20121206/5012_1 /TAXON_ID=160619 /ORGANISM="Kryptoperidinium foliaceum, Strain CCMP 1326" /LENGTH=345 /DNA_ID=CAMNT_0017343757 /DNA_START=52 /DNA_END=1089 /DNA_ORIENTATION=+